MMTLFAYLLIRMREKKTRAENARKTERERERKKENVVILH